MILRPSQTWECYKMMFGMWVQAWSNHIQEACRAHGNKDNTRRAKSMFESWLLGRLGGKLPTKIILACGKFDLAHVRALIFEVEARCRASGVAAGDEATREVSSRPRGCPNE